MIASVEAIFLSTFVLISQNRMAAAADKRADLDLQISLLAEHEVTKLVTLVSGIADRMGVKRGRRRRGGDHPGRCARGGARRARGGGTGRRAALRLCLTNRLCLKKSSRCDGSPASLGHQGTNRDELRSLATIRGESGYSA